MIKLHVNIIGEIICVDFCALFYCKRSVSALRNTISEFQYANIPPSHQILLIGPAPFHSLDNQVCLRV